MAGSPETSFHEQLDRIDRLLAIVEANDPYKILSGLRFYDVLIFACQSMWHLKDWIINDSNFEAKDLAMVRAEIHAEKCLLLCSDIANGTKHLALKHPKVDGNLSEYTGFRYDSSEGICQKYYYIACPESKDEFHGMEVRELLRRCRDAWQGIINRHYLSAVDDEYVERAIQAYETSKGDQSA